jgi:hypothetical protein
MEVARFNATATIYIRTFQLSTQTAIKKLAFELEGRVKERTPVDTGRLRASIHTVLYGEGRAFAYSASSLSKSEQGRVRAQAKAGGVKAPRIAKTSFDGTLQTVPRTPYEAVVGTNVNYAKYLEHGSSKMAPRAMFRFGLMSLRGSMRYAIARELGSHG